MTNQTTILIVDDDPLIITVISRIIARVTLSPLRILTASNGEEGLRKALQDRPDLIIADLIMPRMDGYDMIKSLRQNECGNRVPIVGISATQSSANARSEEFHRLCDSFVLKPFVPNELLEKLPYHVC